MRKLIWVLCIAAAFSGAAAADEGHHHEELTQEQLGTVHFPVSCTPEAQKTFEKGVALLHSFWYEESEKTRTRNAMQTASLGAASAGSCRLRNSSIAAPATSAAPTIPPTEH